MEAAVFPGEEVGGFAGAEVLAVAEGMKEAVAEEFGHGAEVGGGHAVEAAFFIEQAIGDEDVDMGMEKKVVAKGVGGGFLGREHSPGFSNRCGPVRQGLLGWFALREIQVC